MNEQTNNDQQQAPAPAQQGVVSAELMEARLAEYREAARQAYMKLATEEPPLSEEEVLARLLDCTFDIIQHRAQERVKKR